tara:strand:+ start:4485 stop:5123 length:639 start_codon:yes stop_codon:yes gene_type:complete
MESGILHFAGYSPVYSGGTSTKVDLSISTSHIAYVVLEESKDQIKWSQVAQGLVKTDNDLAAVYPIQSDSNVRIRLYGGIGEMSYTLNFEDAKPPTTIGSVTIDGNTDIETGSTSSLSCACDGDATDLVYRWSTNSANIAIVGTKTSKTVQVSGISETSGNCFLMCTVTSATATDGSGGAQAQISVSDPSTENNKALTEEPEANKKAPKKAK